MSTADTTRTEQLQQELDRHVLRFGEREEDWDAFAFEEVVDPNYRRAQLRYLGAGGSGKYGDDRVLPPDGFTLSIMRMPPGSAGPAHTHEVEEVFFCLRGPLVVFWWEDGVQVETTLHTWDLVYNPAGRHRGFRNDAGEDGYLQIMLGRARPAMPFYPDPRLEALKREKAAALAAQYGEPDAAPAR